MPEGTSARLDTVDTAETSGWEVDWATHTDVFTKGDSRIEVHYAADDTITSAVHHGAHGDLDTLGEHAAEKVEHVRSWLTGRSMSAGGTVLYPEASFVTEQSGWKRSEFIAAVEDPSDRRFLLSFLELVDANDQLPARGSFGARLCFGKRPGGGLLVYPFARRFPPFKFTIKDGQLMISGCWTRFKSAHHPGFAEIAALLGQDETGSGSAVPVSGLDPGELWAVGDRVSEAVN